MKFLMKESKIDAHSIQVKGEDIEIISSKFINCSKILILMHAFIDSPKLQFQYNTFTFSEQEKSGGCVHLITVTNHLFYGNIFENARIDDNNLERAAACISFVSETSQDYSLTIKNNTFDNVSSNS